MAQPTNIRLGGFETIRRLPNSGGQGIVYEARCVEPQFDGVNVGDIVVLKVMTVQDPDGDLLRRLKHRTDALVAIRHPNIVRYYGCFAEDRDFSVIHAVVMDYLDGQTLKECLDQNPKGLDADVALGIVRDCLAALQHAASDHKIIHRDIKPGNIFLCKDGTTKFIDFELARQEGGSATVSSQGNLRGSFDYMAPDFIEPDFHGDEQSDVFSMAVCLHEAISGRTPYERVSGSVQQASFFFHNRWKPLDGSGSENVIKISQTACRPIAHIQSVLKKALSPNRAERFASFKEFSEAFAPVKIRVITHDDNQYELLRVIGQGGFGEVFKARRVSDGRLVAIKHLLKSEYAGRFIREAKLIQSFSNPRLVRFIDFFKVEQVEGEQYFLVMDFLSEMPGSSLSDRLRGAKAGLPLEEVLLGFIRFAEGLAILHRSEVYHRDIKPSNLYLPEGRPGDACIMDMGVARDAKGSLTFGNVPGTLDFMPPEVAFGDSRGDAGMDIYALGLCLYEALTAKSALPRLPPGDAAVKAFIARAREKQKPLLDHPLVAENSRLHNLLVKMTDPDAAQREQDANTIAEALIDLLPQASVDVTAKEPNCLSLSEQDEAATSAAVFPDSLQPTRPPPTDMRISDVRKNSPDEQGLAPVKSFQAEKEELLSDDVVLATTSESNFQGSSEADDHDAVHQETVATKYQGPVDAIKDGGVVPAGETVVTRAVSPDEIDKRAILKQPPQPQVQEPVPLPETGFLSPTQFLELAPKPETRSPVVPVPPTPAAQESETGRSHAASAERPETCASAVSTPGSSRFGVAEPAAVAAEVVQSPERAFAVPTPAAEPPVRMPVAPSISDAHPERPRVTPVSAPTPRVEESVSAPKIPVAQPSPVEKTKRQPKPFDPGALRMVRQAAAALVIIALSGLAVFVGWYYWDTFSFNRDLGQFQKAVGRVSLDTTAEDYPEKTNAFACIGVDWKERVSKYLKDQPQAIIESRTEKIQKVMAGANAKLNEIVQNAQAQAGRCKEASLSAYKGSGANDLQAGDDAFKKWEQWIERLGIGHTETSGDRLAIAQARKGCVDRISDTKVAQIIGEYEKNNTEALNTGDAHKSQWVSWLKEVNSVESDAHKARLSLARENCAKKIKEKIETAESLATQERIQNDLSKVVQAACLVTNTLIVAAGEQRQRDLEDAIAKARKYVDVSEAQKVCSGLAERIKLLKKPIGITVAKPDNEVTVKYAEADGDLKLFNQATGIKVRFGTLRLQFEKADYENIASTLDVSELGKDKIVPLPSGDMWKAKPSLRKLAALAVAIRDSKWDEGARLIEESKGIAFENKENEHDWLALSDKVQQKIYERKTFENEVAKAAALIRESAQKIGAEKTVLPVKKLAAVKPTVMADSRVKAAIDSLARSLSNHVDTVACVAAPLDTRASRLAEAMDALAAENCVNLIGAACASDLRARIAGEQENFVLAVTNRSGREIELSVGDEAKQKLAVGGAGAYPIRVSKRSLTVAAAAIGCRPQTSEAILLSKGGGKGISIDAFVELPGHLKIADSTKGLPPLSIALAKGDKKLALGDNLLEAGSYEVLCERADYVKPAASAAVKIFADKETVFDAASVKWDPTPQLHAFQEAEAAWNRAKGADALKNYPADWDTKDEVHLARKKKIEESALLYFTKQIQDYERSLRNALIEAHLVTIQVSDPEKQTPRTGPAADAHTPVPTMPDFMLERLAPELKRVLADNGVALTAAMEKALEKVKDAHSQYFNENYPNSALNDLSDAIKMSYVPNGYDSKLAKYFYDKCRRKLDEDVAEAKKAMAELSPDTAIYEGKKASISRNQDELKKLEEVFGYIDAAYKSRGAEP